MFLKRALYVLVFAFAFTGLAATQFASIEFDIPGPPNSVTFGDQVFALPNGNIVVRDSGYLPPGARLGATAAGAVHLVNGRTGQIISTLTGNQVEDDVGRGIYVLPNGDYVVTSDTWASGGTLQVGAVTHCNGTTGCSGTINSTNSLIGSTADDRVGSELIVLPNGNYVTFTGSWHDTTSAKLGGGTPGVGALTFCNGATGCTGLVTPANSVVGSNLNDFQESRIKVFPNGDFLIHAPQWDGPSAVDTGAVRKCSGTTGCTGPFSSSNSIVGNNAQDFVGGEVELLPNGGYAVISTSFSPDQLVGGGPINNAGAVTFCNDAMGCTGTISASNSLVGSSPDDFVGNRGVTVLPNGKVLVGSDNWDNAGAVNAGAVTICPSVTQCTGTVTTANSLHGVSNGDIVGSYVKVLANGNYVVRSGWIGGVGISVGAVTFCDGTAGCTGPVTTANSLHGVAGSNDRVGSDGVIALPNGNYLVESAEWDSATATNVGAVTFCNGATGCVGEVDASNSLLGIDNGDTLGNFGTTVLANGNFVVVTAAAGPNDEGAVTFCSGTTGCPLGPVNASNSLFGVSSQDRIGGNGILALDNSNYVVKSPGWDRISTVANGVPGGDQGAATFCSGTTGCTGSVTEANSLVGNNDGDQIGRRGLSLGNKYLVGSQKWGGSPGLTAGPVDQNFGALAFCDAVVGCTGEITSENSLIGLTGTTELGNVGITQIDNGDYIVESNEVAFLTGLGEGGSGPGSLTYGDGTNGTFGVQTTQNTIFSTASGFDWVYDSVNEQIVAGRGGDNVVTLFRNAAPQRAPYDFDGDGRTDISVFRPSTGTWWLNQSTDGVLAAQFGAAGDVIVPADYDGDGKTDMAVWRPGLPNQARFFIFNSSDFSVTETPFGQTGDDPVVVGDWDGDGKADPAVYRDSAAGAQSRFYFIGSDSNPGNNITFLNWGTTGDKPAKGDFDGDGVQDLAVFRSTNNSWWIRQSSDSAVTVTYWGLSTDKLVPGDYDGDAKTDLAVFRESEGNWYYRQSLNGETFKFPWGTTGDIPVSGDYDGDGKIDPSVFRPSDGVWYLNNTVTATPVYVGFGLTTDSPVPAASVTE